MTSYRRTINKRIHRHAAAQSSVAKTGFCRLAERSQLNINIDGQVECRMLHRGRLVLILLIPRFIGFKNLWTINWSIGESCDV